MSSARPAGAGPGVRRGPRLPAARARPVPARRPTGRRPLSCTCTAAGGGAARAASRCPCWERTSTTPLTTQGFAVAAIDYRLSGEARFPAPLEDVRTAISWVRDHAASYGLDADRVFLWGDSAGGHLALLAALTGSTVHGVVAWFPVTDLAGLPSDVADAGGVPDPGPQSREAQLLGAPAVVGTRSGAAGEPGDPRQRRRAADPADARGRGRHGAAGPEHPARRGAHRGRGDRRTGARAGRDPLLERRERRGRDRPALDRVPARAG